MKIKDTTGSLAYYLLLCTPFLHETFIFLENKLKECDGKAWIGEIWSLMAIPSHWSPWLVEGTNSSSQVLNISWRHKWHYFTAKANCESHPISLSLFKVSMFLSMYLCSYICILFVAYLFSWRKLISPTIHYRCLMTKAIQLCTYCMPTHAYGESAFSIGWCLILAWPAPPLNLSHTLIVYAINMGAQVADW